MQRLLFAVPLVLISLVLGVALGAGLLLLHPQLPLSAIAIDMREGTFKFELAKLLPHR
jgi:hypothetical protein